MIRHIVYKLQDWLLPLRLRLGQKLLYSKDFKIVRVSRSELIKGPCLSQELEAMEYVSANTTICLPRIHRTYTRADGLYIAMDFVRGDRLDDLWPHISDEEKRKLVIQVQEVVAKLHECAPPVALGDVAVASARGGPVSDGAFGIEGHRAMVRGPFQDVDGFEDFLVDNPNAQGFERFPGRVTFVHADLAPRSVIRKPSGELCIISWDFAGWWPVCKSLYFIQNRNSLFSFNFKFNFNPNPLIISFSRLGAHQMVLCRVSVGAGLDRLDG